jgi:hypothetical protein
LVGPFVVFSVLEISADQTLDWVVRVENDRWEAAPSQKSPQWPGKPKELIEITTINEICFRYLTMPSQWQEDEWMPAVCRAAYQAYTSIRRMIHKQSNLRALQVVTSANIPGDEFDARAF